MPLLVYCLYYVGVNLLSRINLTNLAVFVIGYPLSFFFGCFVVLEEGIREG